MVFKEWRRKHFDYKNAGGCCNLNYCFSFSRYMQQLKGNFSENISEQLSPFAFRELRLLPLLFLYSFTEHKVPAESKNNCENWKLSHHWYNDLNIKVDTWVFLHSPCLRWINLWFYFREILLSCCFWVQYAIYKLISPILSTYVK